MSVNMKSVTIIVKLWEMFEFNKNYVFANHVDIYFTVSYGHDTFDSCLKQHRCTR